MKEWPVFMVFPDTKKAILAGRLWGRNTYLLCHTFLYIVHGFFQAAVHDPCVMLGHACGGMTEHDGHVLQGDIVGERDSGSESMAGHMRGQIFLYVAEIGDFLKVAVHFLVA